MRKIVLWTENMLGLDEFLVSKFDGFTLIVGVGQYKESTEQAAVITVFTDYPFAAAVARAREVAQQIKAQFDQKEVLIEVTDVNTFFV